MNPPKIVSLLLVAFLGASLIAVIYKELAQTSGHGTQTAATIDMKPIPEQATSLAKQDEKKTSSINVIAYYFHGNFRCTTCLTIEALTREGLETGFPEEMKNGRVKLKVINIEKPENEHYAEDYQLASRSVVLSLQEDGEQKTWKRLDSVWELVKDKEAFLGMIQEEVSSLLKDAN